MPEEQAEYKINELVCKTIGALSNTDRKTLFAIRQALLIALGAIEEFLGIERSVTPKHKRLQ
jgi:hypothetical protein